MWLYGKPGSGDYNSNRLQSSVLTFQGKSVLASQIISFLRLKRDTRILFFFCDYHSTPYEITARIFRAFTAQMMGIAPETIPFFYDEFLVKER